MNIDTPRGARAMQGPTLFILAAAIFSSTVAPTSAGELLVSNFNADTIGRWDTASRQFLGNYQAGVGLDSPLCARVGPDGLLYVASEATNSIQRYNPQTQQFVDTFIAPGSGGLSAPTGITWDASGNAYVSSFNTDSILKYDAGGAFVSTFVTGGSGELDGPDNGTIIGPDGDLYVPSYWNNRVLRFDGETGAFVSRFVMNIGRPRVLEFRGDFLYITSENANAVRKYDALTGAPLGLFTQAGSGGMSVPIGMVFGDDGYLYVSSGANHNVLRYSATDGSFVDEFIAAGAGGTNAPVFLTMVPEPSAVWLLLATLAWTLSKRR